MNYIFNKLVRLAVLFLVPVLFFSCSSKGGSSVTKENFGQTKLGEKVERYSIVNANGMSAKIMTYGALLTELNVKDKKGELRDMVLGYDTLEPYLERHPYFGCTAGRYANRIAKGKFTLEGKRYQLATNNGDNHLHGGVKGFDTRVWQAKIISSSSVAFSYTSPDMEEGYPGTLKTTVTYTLSDDDALSIDYKATSDKTTIVNLTHHSYFNLNGAGSGTVYDHLLKIESDHFLPVDAGSIPKGEMQKLKGDLMDFSKEKSMGADIAKVINGAGGKDPEGYDHNYVLRNQKGTVAKAATAYSAQSGIQLVIETTEPGIQFYTGNWLNNIKGKAAKNYVKHGGFCLEAQKYPDSPNRPEYPSCVLKPGEIYHQSTVHRFSIR
jgi:aldose 1-epimerase